MLTITARGAALMLALVLGSAAADASDPLVEAVKRGDRALVHALLGGGARVDEGDPDGMTALHWAVEADDGELAEALIGAGADVRAVTRYGVSPLMLAAGNGNAALVDRLLQTGADPQAATPEGVTPLMIAARTGRVEVAELLLDRGADAFARERWNGDTALMWAARENHAAITRLLVARGASIDDRSAALAFPEVKVDIALVWRVELPRGGLTPLMFAARQGALASAEALAELGADVNLTDPDGTSALVMAIINGHYDVAAMLLDRGADPDVADAAGMGALYAAIDMLHKEPMFNRPVPRPSGTLAPGDIVARILGRGGNPDLRLKTPLLPRQHDAGDPLLGAGATPLMRAAKAGDAALMSRLIERGADPGAALENGTTVLMVAAAQTAPETDTRAAIEAVRLCLAHGIDINGANANGETALHLAVGKSDEMIRFLADHGARLEAKDKAGRTPLDVARGAPAQGRDGRPGRPGPVHEATAALLRRLMGGDTGAARPAPGNRPGS